MNLENVDAAILGRFGNSILRSMGPTKKRLIENIEAVRRHDDLDLIRRLKTVELVEQLEHRALHFAVAAAFLRPVARLPMESTSSIKRILGACSRADEHSRTILAPSPCTFELIPNRKPE